MSETLCDILTHLTADSLSLVVTVLDPSLHISKESPGHIERLIQAPLHQHAHQPLSQSFLQAPINQRRFINVRLRASRISFTTDILTRQMRGTLLQLYLVVRLSAVFLQRQKAIQ